jgi:hypothetical protein
MRRYEAIRPQMFRNTLLKCNNGDLALLRSGGMIALNIYPYIDSAVSLNNNPINTSGGHFECAKVLSRMASSAMTRNQ